MSIYTNVYMMSPENKEENSGGKNEQSEVRSNLRQENTERLELQLKKLDVELTEDEEKRLQELEEKKKDLDRKRLVAQDDVEDFDKVLKMEQRDRQSRNG